MTPADAYHLPYSTPESSPPIPPPRSPSPPPPTGRGGRRGPSARLVALVIAVVIVVGGGVGLALGRNTATSTQPGTSPSGPLEPTASAPAAVTPSGSAPAASSAPATTPAGSRSVTSPASSPILVPIYYLADVQNAPRLFREFHRVTPVDGLSGPARTIGSALTEMLRGNPVDPDYSSPWPQDTRLLSVTVSGQTATVDLSRFVAVGAAYETAAVQQLVYTVTAADNDVVRVRLLVNGDVAPSGHSDWSAPIGRAPALDVMSLVWILAPEQNATTGSPVRVHVYGTGYEGNVPLRVLQNGTVVASTHVTTMMGGFAEAETTIALAPGRYELRAYTDSGEDGSLRLWDTKTFTVR